ncbi:MAG TPA: hypothetical protein VM142_01715 [Acidimicrobiales bacterium]|nr:hypothetical protein [Acidimicrobiales bacterium]
MTYEELSAKDRDELRLLAIENNIDDPGWGKEDLIHALLEAGA